MFEDTEEMLSLYQAMDRMKKAMVLMLPVVPVPL
jgi:hypothetical protein